MRKTRTFPNVFELPYPMRKRYRLTQALCELFDVPVRYKGAGSHYPIDKYMAEEAVKDLDRRRVNAGIPSIEVTP